MKRSQINEILRAGDEFIKSFGFKLPPFAYWTPEQMVANADTASGIFRARLGWDVTDYGAERFEEMGLFLFTLRNGDPADLSSGRGMLYAEKVMITRRDQLSPMHRHIVKAEDIINRGGGDLVVELFGSSQDGSIDEFSNVSVPCDGQLRTVPAGGKIMLKPGESVTLMPGTWHAFWGERADVLVGEVSTVNDDMTDNVFREPIRRFSEIDEDEAAWRLLVSDFEEKIPVS